MIYFIIGKDQFKYFEDYLNSILVQKSIIVGQILNLEDLKNFDPNDSYILVQRSHNIKSLMSDSKNIFVLNTEQLSRENYLKRARRFSTDFQLIDYSEENCKLIPSIWIPYQVNRKEILNLAKTENVCFVGGRGDYRLKILNEVMQKVGLTYISGWGEERDQKMFRFKIIINIHHGPEYRINEQIRINRCIFNRMIVISEEGLDDDSLYLKDHMILCPYDEITSRTVEVLKNYDYYYDKLFCDMDLDKIEHHYQTQLDKAVKMMAQ